MALFFSSHEDCQHPSSPPIQLNLGYYVVSAWIRPSRWWIANGSIFTSHSESSQKNRAELARRIYKNFTIISFPGSPAENELSFKCDKHHVSIWWEKEDNL